MNFKIDYKKIEKNFGSERAMDEYRFQNPTDFDIQRYELMIPQKKDEKDSDLVERINLEDLE